MTDISGKTLLQQTVQGEENISIGHLSKGVYLIHVNGETTKIIKN
ncbi:MAG: T9SS type A sorting domain-containing protein [Dysgonamonadaceae bacterium]|nr:T9SS type A sorting domain-containing protein [Dysgonamonadaceae bacterium]